MNNAGRCGIGRSKYNTSVFAKCSVAITVTSASAVTLGAWPHCTIGCDVFGENGYRGGRGGVTWRGGGMSDCSRDLPCHRRGSYIDTLLHERSCTVKNRMRELRSCGTMRDEGRKALVYSDTLKLYEVTGSKLAVDG